MFFTVSKIFWLVAVPVNFLLILALIGLAATRLRRPKLGFALLTISVVTLAAALFLPLGTLALRPLENRFPHDTATDTAPTGIIVLGGALNPALSAVRHEFVLSTAGSRLTAGAILARRYPQATLVFSGGSGRLDGGISEADQVERFWRDLGVPPAQMRFERRARSTWENAIWTRDLVNPSPGQHWLLVTSAWHMPRAMGIFRKVGFDVAAYPVDYGTFGNALDYRWQPGGTASLQRLDLAMHEWIGLLVYRLRGRTDALFPAP